jgi:hypothetical protein
VNTSWLNYHPTILLKKDSLLLPAVILNIVTNLVFVVLKLCNFEIAEKPKYAKK